MASTYTVPTGSATTQVITRSGNLMAIVVNKPVNSTTIKLIDGTSGTTANMGTITHTSTAPNPYVIQYGPRGMRFKTGLRVVLSGADDVTLIWE
jgi:hypothetical protein